jgi:hypothetical protein
MFYHLFSKGLRWQFDDNLRRVLIYLKDEYIERFKRNETLPLQVLIVVTKL